MNITTGTGNRAIGCRSNLCLQSCILLILAMNLLSCHTAPVNTEKEIEAKANVKVTNVQKGAITDYIELNATSSFLKKDIIKSTANAYIESINFNLGDEVSRGQILFTLKTKEAVAIGNSIHDTSLHFNGIIYVRSPKEGFISLIYHQKGDYVQDGEQVAVVAERNSLVFLLDVPFEYHRFLKEGNDCEIVLPDKEVIKGSVSTSLSSMDVNSQTEGYIVRPATQMKLPENLITKVRLVKSLKDNAQTLPRSAVLADETQSSFWVMKILNDSTAVKIPVIKGIENNENIEITSPDFNSSDRIILSGNYGLPDTAKINVVK
jgi:hypothetical protein